METTEQKFEAGDKVFYQSPDGTYIPVSINATGPQYGKMSYMIQQRTDLSKPLFDSGCGRSIVMDVRRDALRTREQALAHRLRGGRVLT